MTQSGNATRPGSVGAALGLLIDALTRERALFVIGMVGLALGIGGLLVAAVVGPIIEPEGVLSKAYTFDLAVGIYVLTVSLFLPLAGFTAAGLRRWRGWQVGLTSVLYGFENIQIARGLDPRFTTHGTSLDQALGGVFFLTACGLITLFVLLGVRIFHTPGAVDGIRLATRYAFSATMLAFGAGLWMSFGGGSTSGEANILLLHAAGFHGLQAVPIVALASGWAGRAATAARRDIHLAGLAWLGVCVAIAAETAFGRPVLEVSVLPVVTLLLLLAWMAVFLRSAISWLDAG